jgi:hypothetical protein
MVRTGRRRAALRRQALHRRARRLHAIGEGVLCIVGVWESEERVRSRWPSEEFEDVLTSAGFPSPKTAAITILELHATEPPLLTDKTPAFAEEIDSRVAGGRRQDPASPGGYREHPFRPGRVLRPLTVRDHASR